MPGESPDDPPTKKKQYSVETTVEFDERAEPTLTIVQTVADATNQSVLDLAPLTESIDADALNRLFSEQASGHVQDLEVTFAYADSIVTVSRTGNIRVTPA